MQQNQTDALHRFYQARLCRNGVGGIAELGTAKAVLLIPDFLFEKAGRLRGSRGERRGEEHGRFAGPPSD